MDRSSESTDQTVIEHWNGTSWSVVPSPNGGGGAAMNELTGVAAVSANNIWAVGSFLDPNANVFRSLTEHWDGTSWSVIPSPNVTRASDSLSSVTANSNRDVVAVGDAALSNGEGNGLVLANNEPAGSTTFSPSPTPTPTPSPTPINQVVVGTFGDLPSGPGKKVHASG
jgi:hypothetical protein